MSVSTYATYDLDLYELDQERDPERLVQMMSQLVDADNDYKIFAARQWVENFLYFAGIRDIYSRFASGTVTGSSLLSNIFPQVPQNTMSTYRRRISKTFKAVQVTASNVTRQRPSIKVWPQMDDERSVKDAKLSNIVLDYLWDIDHEDDINYECVLWALLSPTVARKEYLDFSFNKSRLWPVEEEIRDPITGQVIIDPNTGQPQKRLKVKPNGDPVVQQLPWNKTEVVPAFRLIFNPSTSWYGDMDFCADVSVKRLQWVHQNFLRQGKGYYPENVEKIGTGTWKFTPIMAMENALKQLTFGAFRSYRNWNYSQTQMKDGVTYVNCFVKPTPNYPQGREICVVNGVLLYDGDSREYQEDPMTWHPYSFLCYERVPGRMWGTTYAEKITDINRAYESARSDFDKLRRTFSVAKMTMPIGSQIDRDTVEGGEQIFRYNPFGPDGGKPSYLNAPQPPTTIMDDTKLIASEFQEMSGVTEIMQGIRPQGVTTYRGLEVLREESNNVQNPFIRMIESFIQRSQMLKLQNIRKSLVYPDKNLANAIRIFKKMSQNVTDIDIANFVGDNLSGYVKIEPLSSIAKSRLAMQEKYMSLAQMGVLGDIVNDPDLNQEFKRKMDVMGFDKPTNRHVVYARYETGLMFEAERLKQVINPPVLPWQDDAIHLREIDMQLNDPTMQGKQFILQSLIAHRDAHLQAMAMKQAQQAASMVNTQMPPDEGKKSPNSKKVIAGQGEQGVMFGPETGFTSQPSNELV